MTDATRRPAAAAQPKSARARRGLAPLLGWSLGAAASLVLWALIGRAALGLF